MASRRRSTSPEPIHVLSSGSDSDTSLVLEDLVRIGEASRLRRRGALRLDTANSSTAAAAAAAAAHDDGLLSGLVAAAHASGSHRVFCGARDPSRPDDAWTGCRALVHDAAAPAVRDGTWFARGAAHGTLVRMSEAFFERGGRRLRRPCGCASDGVGCRVCGNALGIVYRPCVRHLRLFPDGPRPLYSFFAAATHADPPFAFPPPAVPPPPLNSPREPQSPPASPADDVIELLEPLDSPKF
ncbi:hypothetical protein AURDEDRAFT_145073 [Auricularia subglabra TFB-10046 SS5]|nr:hypothetical protein AURDEDRAFT_145073 [Auricularia subglabra TFB-10046 SS5]